MTLPGVLAMAMSLAGDGGRGTAWRQFGWWTPWADVQIAGEWRRQRHALDRSERILDGQGREVLRGPGDAAAEFRRRTAEAGVAAPAGHVVVLLHGVVRTRNSMGGLAKRLRAEGLQAFAVDYASTHRPLAEHGETLHELLDNLPAATRIDLVCHSMGGLVAREALGRHPDPRVKRLVMLGTPNQGAEKADFFGDWRLFQAIFGPAGQDLRTAGIAARVPLPPPAVEVGVVAGGLEQRLGGIGISPFLPRDNDGVVSVDYAKLPGMKDFLVVPVQHTLLPWSSRVQDAVVRFLAEGRFAAPDIRAASGDRAAAPR